jgi:four helix bundle protein
MFDVYEVAKESVRGLRPVLETVQQSDRDLARQMRRAGASVVLNIAEGWRRLGRDRRQHYVIAAGSNAEVRAALDVCEALGYLDNAAYAELDALLDRVSAMLYRLTH